MLYNYYSKFPVSYTLRFLGHSHAIKVWNSSRQVRLLSIKWVYVTLVNLGDHQLLF